MPSGYMVTVCFQVLPEMFDWLPFRAPAGPLQDVHWFVPSTLPHCLGCLPGTIVLFESELQLSLRTWVLWIRFSSCISVRGLHQATVPDGAVKSLDHSALSLHFSTVTIVFLLMWKCETTLSCTYFDCLEIFTEPYVTLTVCTFCLGDSSSRLLGEVWRQVSLLSVNVLSFLHPHFDFSSAVQFYHRSDIQQHFLNSSVQTSF